MDPQWQGLLDVAVACLLGGIVGLERQLADKPAGLRTHVLVCGGAALLIVISRFAYADFVSQPHPELVRINPIRIMQAIIIGISFLGAGTIIHPQGGQVHGLTTAGSILMAAAIGMAVGLHLFVLAVGVSALVVVVLYGLGHVDGWFIRRRARRSGDEQEH